MCTIMNMGWLSIEDNDLRPYRITHKRILLSPLSKEYFEYMFNVYINWEVCFHIYLGLVINSIWGISYGWMSISLSTCIPLFCRYTCFMECDLSRIILLLYSHWKLHRYIKIILMIEIQYWFSWINRCKVKSTQFSFIGRKREYIVNNPMWVYLLSWLWIWCVCIIWWDV